VSLVGIFLSFLEEEKPVKTGGTKLFLPQGKKKGYIAVQNNTVLSFFFNNV